MCALSGAHNEHEMKIIGFKGLFVHSVFSCEIILLTDFNRANIESIFPCWMHVSLDSSRFSFKLNRVQIP